MMNKHGKNMDAVLMDSAFFVMILIFSLDLSYMHVSLPQNRSFFLPSRQLLLLVFVVAGELLDWSHCA